MEFLNDLKAILETVKSIQKVSHGKPSPISTEDEFNAIYILPQTETYEQRTNGTKLKSYDYFAYVTLLVNVDTKEDLDFILVKEDIINSVLNDELLLTKVIDRAVLSVNYDNFENYPKREFEVTFEFRCRAECTI